jgi:hypothetical protein
VLSPDYLLRVSEGGEAIAETLHNEIIKQIVERIAIRLERGDDYILTARDKWQIEVLQDAGFLREDIEKTIARQTALMQKEIAQAMEEAGVKAMEYDDEIYRAAGLDPEPLTQSPHLIRMLQRGYEATVGEWVNFTRTTADAVQQSFIQACDKAYNMVYSGAVGYSQAYVDAINEIAGGGVYVTYPSGHRDTIETATLRCIRTGVSQATAQITDARMDEMGWDIILVSSHLGARVTDREDFTNHYWWQGKFYSRSGRDARFPPFSVCGMGDVQGIHGANCRHQHGPGDGEFNPFKDYDSEENKKRYQLEQQQRAMERRIRDSKRKCMGLKEGMDNAQTEEAKQKLQEAYTKEAALLKKRNQAYNNFCEETGLKKKNERITIAQWDRKQAAKAGAAARKQNGENKKKVSAEKKPVAKSQSESLRDRLIKCENTGEVSAACQDHFLKKGSKIKTVEFGNTDTDAAKQMAEILDQLDSQYNSSMTSIRVKWMPDTIGGKAEPTDASFQDVIKTGDMSKLESEVTINETFLESKAKIQLDFEKARRASQYAASTNAAVDEKNAAVASLVHEYAHTICPGKANEVYQSITGNLNPDFMTLRRQYRMYMQELRNREREIQRMKDSFAGQTDGLQKGLEAAKELQDEYNAICISRYSKASVGEFIAEAFVDATLSSNPKPASRQVLEIINKLYGKGG